MRQGRSRNGVGTVEPARVRRAAERLLGMAAAGLLVEVVVFPLIGVLGAAAAAPAPAPRPLGGVVIHAVGPGYSATSQGALNPSVFASDTPDPSAASSALTALGHSMDTYERTWQAEGGLNEVQDVLVRFPSSAAARTFLLAAQRSLDSGEIVSKGPLTSIPGAWVVTYFGATSRSGVGEAITMRTGRYVALLLFFSAAAGNAPPITPADADGVVRAQHATMTTAGELDPPTAGAHKRAPVAAGAAKKSGSSTDVGWAVVAVAVVAVAVATPLLLRHRRGDDHSPR